MMVLNVRMVAAASIWWTCFSVNVPAISMGDSAKDVCLSLHIIACNTSLAKGDYVFGSVGLSVCLSACL